MPVAENTGSAVQGLPALRRLGERHHLCTPDEGWLYLAGHKDLFSGNIVGYAMGERLARNLISQSLFRAVAAKRPSKGLIHHSD